MNKNLRLGFCYPVLFMIVYSIVPPMIRLFPHFGFRTQILLSYGVTTASMITGVLLTKIIITENYWFQHSSLLFDLSVYTYITTLFNFNKNSVLLLSLLSSMFMIIFLLSYLYKELEYRKFLDKENGAIKRSQRTFDSQSTEIEFRSKMYEEINNNTLDPMKYKLEFPIITIWIIILGGFYYWIGQSLNIVGITLTLVLVFYQIHRRYTGATILDTLFKDILQTDKRRFIDLGNVADFLDTNTTDLITPTDIKNDELMKYEHCSKAMYTKENELVKGEIERIYDIKKDEFNPMFVTEDGRWYQVFNNPLIYIDTSEIEE